MKLKLNQIKIKREEMIIKKMMMKIKMINRKCLILMI